MRGHKCSLYFTTPANTICLKRCDYMRYMAFVSPQSILYAIELCAQVCLFAPPPPPPPLFWASKVRRNSLHLPRLPGLRILFYSICIAHKMHSCYRRPPLKTILRCFPSHFLRHRQQAGIRWRRSGGNVNILQWCATPSGESISESQLRAKIMFFVCFFRCQVAAKY